MTTIVYSEINAISNVIRHNDESLKSRRKSTLHTIAEKIHRKPCDILAGYDSDK